MAEPTINQIVNLISVPYSLHPCYNSHFLTFFLTSYFIILIVMNGKATNNKEINYSFYRISRETSGDSSPMEDESSLSESDLASTLDKITLDWVLSPKEIWVSLVLSTKSTLVYHHSRTFEQLPYIIFIKLKAKKIFIM